MENWGLSPNILLPEPSAGLASCRSSSGRCFTSQMCKAYFLQRCTQMYCMLLWGWNEGHHLTDRGEAAVGDELWRRSVLALHSCLLQRKVDSTQEVHNVLGSHQHRWYCKTITFLQAWCMWVIKSWLLSHVSKNALELLKLTVCYSASLILRIRYFNTLEIFPICAA